MWPNFLLLIYLSPPCFELHHTQSIIICCSLSCTFLSFVFLKPHKLFVFLTAKVILLNISLPHLWTLEKTGDSNTNFYCHFMFLVSRECVMIAFKWTSVFGSSRCMLYVFLISTMEISSVQNYLWCFEENEERNFFFNIWVSFLCPWN